MRRILTFTAVVASLLMPIAVYADSTSIVNLNSATPDPNAPVPVATLDPALVTPTSTPTPTPTPAAMPVTGTPASLPFILLGLISAAGYAAYRLRSQS